MSYSNGGSFPSQWAMHHHISLPHFFTCWKFLLKTSSILQNTSPCFSLPKKKSLYLPPNLQNRAPHFFMSISSRVSWRSPPPSKFQSPPLEYLYVSWDKRVFLKENTKLICAYHLSSPIIFKNFLIIIFNSPNVIFNNAQKSFFPSQSLIRINFSLSVGKFP